MKTVAIVQARCNSKRLPNKVLLPLSNETVISFLLKRLSKAKFVDEIIVATTVDSSDDKLAEHIKSLGVKVCRGSIDDVLDRYCQAAIETEADTIIRITGDCPIIDPVLVDRIVKVFMSSEMDYVSNTLNPTFPDGLDIEVMSFQALLRAKQFAKSNFDREHVTPFIKNSADFSVKNIENNTDLSDLRWTLDEREDYQALSLICDTYAPNKYFQWKDILLNKSLCESLKKINHHIPRDEGSIMSTGQKLWKRAKGSILGGNSLLSKRPDMFLPDHWPVYFEKAKGCHVWDLDGNKYIDTSIMGIGTNVLGYGHPKVDEAVKNAAMLGNMSTLNCPEEVYLAEKLLEIHPWAAKAKFARSGGEANAIALRIARAKSNKKNVAICGYHGWHDWYLSVNLTNSDGLNEHLLPGLSTQGVNPSLANTTYPFKYNDFDQLKVLVEENDVGVIFMEVMRNQEPTPEFLKDIRKLATDNNAILIFDECTSGFRKSFGGLHLNYDVYPDLAMFGKALGNGYAITAVLGTEEVMEAANESFISSSFWTERIGNVAALKTLEIMEETESWAVIDANGRKVLQNWEKLAASHGFEIETSGLPALASFKFKGQENLVFKTYITQEMLKCGFLASNSFYSSVAHNSQIMDQYFNELDGVFKNLANYENLSDVAQSLDGDVCASGFARLN